MSDEADVLLFLHLPCSIPRSLCLFATFQCFPFSTPPPPLSRLMSYLLASPLLPPLSLPQWVPTLAGTAARRPRAVWSPTPASCPWLSPPTTPSPERDSPPTTPSARGASPRATKTRVRSRSSDEKMRGGGWRGGSTCHLALGRTRERRTNTSTFKN